MPPARGADRGRSIHGGPPSGGEADIGKQAHEKDTVRLCGLPVPGRPVPRPSAADGYRGARLGPLRRPGAIFRRRLQHPGDGHFRVYDWALYGPEDFAARGPELSSGEAPEEYRSGAAAGNISEYYRGDLARYKTDHLELALEAGKTYGIHVENATYAMRLWVDGVLLAENGTVSNSKEGFVPRTRSNTVFFTASGDVTSIVMQRANFNHAYWNTAVIKLGAAERIEAMAQKQLIGVCMTIITLLAVAMINLGMFFCSPKRVIYLFFALACASIAIRTSLTDPKPIMLLFEDLNWYFGHRLEHCAFMLTGLFLLLFYYGVFERFLPKWLPVVSVVLAGAILGAYVALPSLTYSRFSSLFQTASIGWLLIFFVGNGVAVIRHRKTLSAFQWMTFAGELLYLFSVAFDRVFYGSLETVSISGAGVVCVSFMQTVAFSMDYRQTQEAYETAHERELELEQMNENLVRLGHVREAFLENLIHELKSPLAVIASGCGVSAMQLRRGQADDRIIDRMKLAETEAVRLGRLIDRTGNVSLSPATALSVTKETVLSILRDTALFCEPICQKRGNRVEIRCGEADLLYCDRDLMLQALYNLVINASRHAQNSAILLTGQTDHGRTVITVADHGDGIRPELREKVFERGFSGDGGTGYGLAICKAVMDMHHGAIDIRDNEGGGTVVALTIPGKDDEDVANSADRG